MLRSLDIQDEREFYLTVEEMKIFVAQLLLLVKLDLKHNGIASFDIEVLKGGVNDYSYFPDGWLEGEVYCERWRECVIAGHTV